MSSADYRALSFWMSTVEDDLTPRPSLGGSIDVDIAIVGAGYTGLWTAYYLAVADPSLRIAVLEAETAGFGASGRNGGWCSALFPLSVPSLARRYGRERAVALQRAMHDTVDEVGRVAGAEGIDCHFAKGGMVALARTPVQLDRARSEVAQAREFGFGSEDLVLLGVEEARAHCGATDVLGGTFSPHCAAIDPARLVRGLARAAERRGVRIYERTPASALTSRMVETGHGAVRADVVVRATEGYTPRLRGLRRALAPVYSLMIATEPLPSSFWASVGLGARETFTDYRHLIIYGQRTADDRLAFGGRGAPYHFGSSIRPSFDRDPRVHRELVEVLRELFPAIGDPAIGDPVIGDPAITHAWGGPLGVPRDWCASVRFDRSTGTASAGGYVGDGVGTSNLAGRTLADLITGTSSDLVRLPWVGHRSPNWEPEPLRWLGVNGGLRLMTSADAAEGRTGHPSKRAALFSRFIGGYAQRRAKIHTVRRPRSAQL